MKKTFIAAFLAILALAAAAAFLSFRAKGAAKPPAIMTERNARGVLYEIVDTSASFRSRLPSTIEDMGDLSLVLDPDAVWQSIWRVDNELRLVGSDHVAYSSDGLVAELAAELGPLTGRDNTYLDRAFAAVAQHAGETSGDSVVIVWTDWYCEGMDRAAHRSLEASARSLARNPRVKAVVVVGYSPANSQTMVRDLAPLSAKLRTFLSGDLDKDLVARALEGGAK